MAAEVLASGADLAYDTSSLVSKTGFQQRLHLRLLEEWTMRERHWKLSVGISVAFWGINCSRLFGCNSKGRIGALTMNKSQTEHP